MYPSHLLSDYIPQHQTALIREAERARLARLTRPEKATVQHHWLANVRHIRTRLFGNKASAQQHTARWATEKCCAPVLPGAQCSVCCAL